MIQHRPMWPPDPQAFAGLDLSAVNDCILRFKYSSTAADAYEIAHPPVIPTPLGPLQPGPTPPAHVLPGPRPPEPPEPGLIPTQKAKTFYGSADVTPTTAKMRLVTIAEEIIAVLSSDSNATVKVTVEIAADFPDGASDQIKPEARRSERSLGVIVACNTDPLRHANLPGVALTNIDCDDIPFLEEHRLGGTLFLHHAPFHDRANAVAARDTHREIPDLKPSLIPMSIRVLEGFHFQF